MDRDPDDVALGVSWLAIGGFIWRVEAGLSLLGLIQVGGAIQDFVDAAH